MARPTFITPSLRSTLRLSLRSRPNATTALSRRPLSTLSGPSGPSAGLGRPLRAARLLACTAGASVALALYSSFETGSPLHLDAPPNSNSDTVVEGASQTSFPTTIQPDSCPPLTLIGLGVRTVSFLRVKVYAIAFYADLSGVSLPKDISFEESVNYLIENTTVAVRIVPVRNTSFSHLRDAFLRSLRGRIQAARKDSSLTPAEEDALEAPLTKLREVFPNTQLDKGTPLVVYSSKVGSRSEARELVLQGLGTVSDPWIATTFFKAYFVGEGNSPALFKSVQEGLGRLITR